MDDAWDVSHRAIAKLSEVLRAFDELVSMLHRHPTELQDVCQLIRKHVKSTASTIRVKRTVRDGENIFNSNSSARCLTSAPQHSSASSGRWDEEGATNKFTSTGMPINPSAAHASFLLVAGEANEGEMYRPMASPLFSSVRDKPVGVRPEARASHHPLTRSCRSNSSPVVVERSRLNGVKPAVSARTSRANGMWIHLWPCFGTHSSSLTKAPERVFVRARFRYIADVTEKVAKDLGCQPAPTMLYEPQGKEIKSLQDLVPEAHYLLFPSGGFYRRDAVPASLLTILVENAKHVLCASGFDAKG